MPPRPATQSVKAFEDTAAVQIGSCGLAWPAFRVAARPDNARDALASEVQNAFFAHLNARAER